MLRSEPSVGARLAAAIAAQDAAAIEACFAPAARFRALVPPGLREREGAAEIAALFASWYGDATEIVLVESHEGEVGDRVHVSFRFELVEGGMRYVVEQQLYTVVADGRFERANLLCSGWRPLPTSG